MSSYVYQPLHDGEIRLATLHAGRLADDITLSLSHVVLTPSQAPRKPSLPEIQATLPPGWKVFEELSRRLCYCHEKQNGEWTTQWTHPDPDFDTSRHDVDINQQTRPRSPAYEALSYTWGLATATTELVHIIPDAGDTDTNPLFPATLEIRRNLALALRHLRYEDKPRKFWVDAICINQLDKYERSEQVKRAANIYIEASSVVLWLGLPTEDSATAMQALDFLGSQVVCNTDARMFSAPQAEKPEWYSPQTTLPYDRATWAAIDSLLRRPWFTRVWIVQELHLPRRAVFVCGKDYVLRENFQRAMLTMAPKIQLHPAISREAVRFIMRLTVPIFPTASIWHIMGRAFQRKCTDDRDLIYGALGLFPPSFRDKIITDYSLTTGDVYANFLKSHVSHVSRLELFRVCDMGTQRPGIPSWVPDFTSASGLSVERGASWQFCAGYSACHTSFKGQILEVSGVHAAAIQAVGKVTPDYAGGSGSTFTDIVKAMRNLMDDFQDIKAATEFGIGSQSFMWSVFGRYLKDRLLMSFIGPLKELEPEINESIIFGFGDAEKAVKGSLSYAENYCISMLLKRRVIRTAEGFWGIAPSAAQAGDIIACLLGFDCPIILRRTTGEDFLLVGECLVPELADLRAFLGPLPSPWKVHFHTETIDGAGFYRYFNSETEEESDQDPRMANLPDDIEVVPRKQFERTADDPTTFQLYRNKATGATTKSDPRLTPDALTNAGVAIRRFTLV
ncbi:Heterokaryon incompatibility protein [Paramyrothecium foliicola]|nr:Heterokaryon incompatibility protein [Paramyrothecium foliicola]